MEHPVDHERRQFPGQAVAQFPGLARRRVEAEADVPEGRSLPGLLGLAPQGLMAEGDDVGGPVMAQEVAVDAADLCRLR